MADEKESKEPEIKKEVPLYVAKHRRNELDGEVYNIGDTTYLDGLTVEEIGHVVGRSYYSVVNPDALSAELVEAIAKEIG